MSVAVSSRPWNRANAKDANDRVPYVDLGMRESFASLSDDR
jgi:hypothetical protein